MKFSLIVPVYNTYDYLDKCLKSLVNQKNVKDKYEIVIVNDGSTDDSGKLIEKYLKKYPKLINYIEKENGGVSSARNLGVKEAKGDYLFFIDSDDYIEVDLLSKLEKVIDENNNPDVVRINSRDVKDNGELIKEVIIDECDNEIDLIKSIMREKSLEVPWGYIYNRKFFIDNKFEYLPLVHEDFGLIPIIIYKAKTISQLSYIGYNYVERSTSLTAEANYQKLKKRVDDLFKLYCNHMNIIKRDSEKGRLLRSYSLEAMLNKLTTLNKQDLNKKLKEVKPYLHASDLYCYNIKKVIKKVIFIMNIKLYLSLYKKYKN